VSEDLLPDPLLAIAISHLFIGGGINATGMTRFLVLTWLTLTPMSRNECLYTEHVLVTAYSMSIVTGFLDLGVGVVRRGATKSYNNRYREYDSHVAVPPL